MRHARRWRAGLGVLLAGSVSLSGCTHNHYYGASVPVCGPTVVGSIAADGAEYGAVCEVPNQVVSGGSVVAQRQAGAATVVPAPKAPRVVVSEPRGGSRLAWRRSDPEEGLATTRVEGALDDPTVTR